MLPTFYREYDRGACPRIEKTVLGENATAMGAFSFGSPIDYTVTLPRKVGAAAVVLRLWRDGQASRDLPFAFRESSGGIDTYCLHLDTASLCDSEGCGLFYYQLLFVRGEHTLFTDSINNVDFSLREGGGKPFRLLVYARDFKTPAWFPGATMYHIFVDRFRRGKGPTHMREGTELCEDWDNGIPQYPPYPGAPLANNRFFGGNLWGVAEGLDYLCSLGVNVIYLSPVFEAASNHKYDTADYERVDDGFGGEAALSHLLAEAKARGVRVILDGVFNHTGDDSRYFNRYGHYNSVGAYQSPDSPYADWYIFRHFPDDYECWWNIPILPRLNGRCASCRTYLAGRDGIAADRVRRGVAGWRLDVADELSDEFLNELRESLHAAAQDGEQPLLIGEVWENAADKIAYGKRRRYFLGGQLDSVMNYPLRDAILAFVREENAAALYNTLTELYSSYPRPVSDCLMNVLGTHDTERILTVLGDGTLGDGRSNDELAVARLSGEQYAIAAERLTCAFVLLFTVFGVPSVYYGDEAGMQGYHDPFCRRPFPWGREDASITATVRFLGELRRDNPCYHGGDFTILYHDDHALAYERRRGGNAVITAVNRGDRPIALTLPAPHGAAYEALTPSSPTPSEIIRRSSVSIPAHKTILFREVSQS